MTDLRRIAAQLAYHGPARTDWAKSAACRDMPKDLFFGQRGNPYHEARTACAGCPVLLDCLAETRKYPEDDDAGFRGGLSYKNRARVRALVREMTPRRVAS